MLSVLYVWLVGVVHGPSGAPSNWHWTIATVSLAENVKLAEVCVVGLGGSEAAAIEIEIGTGSRSIAETDPVMVGEPGCGGYGGKSGCDWVDRYGEVAIRYRPDES